MTLARIDLADFGSLDRIAIEIFRLAPEIPIPVPVEDLARQLDIADIRPLETQGFEGGLVTDQEKSTGVILVRQASKRQRRRFSVGHELGHFLSPWHKPIRPEGFLCSEADMRKNSAAKQDRAASMEVEANRFSAQLLMPKARFLADIRKRKGCDLEHVLVLAKHYDTSKEATVRRYVDLQDEPCAAVVSQNGRVIRFYRHDDFPFMDIKVGLPVPKHSVTADTDLTQGVVGEWEEVDGSIWLPSEVGRRTRTVYEQVMPQQGGFFLTLLTVEDEEES